MRDIWAYGLISWLSFLSGFFVRAWLIDRLRSYSGTIVVTTNEEKTVYSLELAENPEELKFKKEIVFKVKTSEEFSDRK